MISKEIIGLSKLTRLRWLKDIIAVTLLFVEKYCINLFQLQIALNAYLFNYEKKEMYFNKHQKIEIYHAIPKTFKWLGGTFLMIILSYSNPVPDMYLDIKRSIFVGAFLSQQWMNIRILDFAVQETCRLIVMLGKRNKIHVLEQADSV